MTADLASGVVGFMQESKGNRDEWAASNTDYGITENPNSYCYLLTWSDFGKYD